MPNSSASTDESLIENIIKTVSSKIIFNSETQINKDSKQPTIHRHSHSLSSDIHTEQFQIGKITPNYLRNPSPSIYSKKTRAFQDMTTRGINYE